MLKRLGFVLLFALLAFPAVAQNTTGKVVASCGNQTFTANNPGPFTVDLTGKLCSDAAVTVTGFQSNGNYATLTATGSSSASTAIPASSTTIRITNTGTAAAVSCVMVTGAATATASKIIVNTGSSVSRVVGAYDHVACIDQSGSTSQVVVVEGGSGLGNDTGGGGGSGGGAVTIADGADVAEGATADAAATAGSTGTVSAKLRLMTTQLDNINTNVQGSIAAGPNAIGSTIPNAATSTQTKVTITTGSTYQQYLASSATRKGCTIQFITASHTGYVFFGAAPADTTTSWQLSPGQTLNCNVGPTVLTDAIQLTSSNDSDVFVVNSW